MPNYCANTLTITGVNSKLLAFKEQASGPGHTVTEIVNPLCFGKFLPLPDRPLFQVANPDGSPGATTRADLEEVEWGCKWGASFVEVEFSLGANDHGRLEYMFLTPWGPPRPFIQKVSEMYPSLTFQLVYSEPSMGFAGLFIVRNGQIAADIDGSFYSYALDAS